MKIAISSRGPSLEDEVDPRFGRAAYILIVDSESLEYEALDNSANVNALKGAGIQTATTVCDKKADVLMTGYCGPKAFQVLQAADVKVVNDASGSVKDAITQLKDGNVAYSTEANTDAHW
ncbi:MAG: dinitrogenase iron-molybdenum cofactor biosynthesis protein [Desulfobacterales bacterium]|nr:MAG: dinitrogenase iron-molybdenum cofactor biosynthesis protein [Desulfobacterales bacterium]